MTGSAFARYAAFARIAVAQSRRERGELYGRVAFFVVILGVFSSLWRAIGQAGMPLALDARAMVWYLAVTEWIVLSTPPVHLEIQEAIRRGDVAYQLGRPVSYVGAQVAAGLGLVATRAPLLAVTAFVCAYGFTRWIPPLRALAMVLPFGVVAIALMTALHVWIGLLAFWLDEVSPVYWLWQKLMFVLGGLMLPLELYPQFIQRAAALTPFPLLVGGPASLIIERAAVTPPALAQGLALWSVAVAVAMHWVFRRATASITINGG